ncbi:unnamed protein product [Prunus armeniaca]|uniref:Uncharacterized protein n=1 Tax=Prunus armeniaca TaxID=36596 RepID=A0A6J5X746_PRUAR|nr:unnamed protein product [Prunus armeniaca]
MTSTNCEAGLANVGLWAPIGKELQNLSKEPKRKATGTVQMGHCSSAALLAMVALTLLTTTHGINNSRGGRATWCDGLSDPSCLIANSDLDGMEFLMESEISRRILAGGPSVSRPALDPSKAASCDRRGFPPCHPGSNRNPPAPSCEKTRYNRECYRN